MTDRLSRHYRWIVLALVVLGAALRVAGAQGGLWLDEAWSAVQAHEAGTPGGVLFGINHDNNHHLNSLWMLLVGFDAPSPLVRGLSIVTGALSIAVAAAIGARRGAGVGIATAALFAVSPVMVTMGSEARGYAPMMLALLVALALVDRWLDDPNGRNPAPRLALCVLLGALSQLTILFAFCAIVGWALITLWQRDGLRAALRTSVSLFAPSVGALAIVFAILALGAMHGGGFHFGNYDPFDWVQFCHGYTEQVEYTVGLPVVSVIWLVLPAGLVIVSRSAGVSKLPFHALAIVGFPLALATLHAGNVAHPRYYLLVGAALLLLFGELLWRGIIAGSWRRWLAAIAFCGIVVASLFQDIDLARNRRGDTALVIRTLQNVAPAGARVAIDRATARAALEVGAAQAGYRLAIIEDCASAPFVLADRFRGDEPPVALSHCNRAYATIASARAHGLSGTNWNLYQQTR